jgi:hypothetical protein
LNDPVELRKRFADQLKDRETGDDEAMTLDECFRTVLAYGTPQTCGVGVGIDQLTMLLTDSQDIKVRSLFFLSICMLTLFWQYLVIFCSFCGRKLLPYRLAISPQECSFNQSSKGHFILENYVIYLCQCRCFNVF